MNHQLCRVKEHAFALKLSDEQMHAMTWIKLIPNVCMGFVAVMSFRTSFTKDLISEEGMNYLIISGREITSYLSESYCAKQRKRDKSREIVVAAMFAWLSPWCCHFNSGKRKFEANIWGNKNEMNYGFSFIIALLQKSKYIC